MAHKSLQSDDPIRKISIRNDNSFEGKQSSILMPQVSVLLEFAPLNLDGLDGLDLSTFGMDGWMSRVLGAYQTVSYN